MSQKSPAEHQAITELLGKIGEDDSNYNSIYNCLSFTSNRTFNRVNKYIQNTHSPKHNQYTMELVKLFEINHPRDNRYKPVDGEKCMLLFHGTEKKSVYSILHQGLRYTLTSKLGLFGQGIYATDCSSKAANFTCDNPMKYDGTADKGIIHPEKRYGYMFLCQMATGLSSVYTGTPKSKDKEYLLQDNQGRICNSVMGVGKYQPSYSEEWTLRNGSVVQVPCGPLKLANKNPYLYQNEYVVYKADRIRPVMLVVVEFKDPEDDSDYY